MLQTPPHLIFPKGTPWLSVNTPWYLVHCSAEVGVASNNILPLWHLRKLTKNYLQKDKTKNKKQSILKLVQKTQLDPKTPCKQTDTSLL